MHQLNSTFDGMRSICAAGILYAEWLDKYGQVNNEQTDKWLNESVCVCMYMKRLAGSVHLKSFQL